VGQEPGRKSWRGGGEGREKGREAERGGSSERRKKGKEVMKERRKPVGEKRQMCKMKRKAQWSHWNKELYKENKE
jgi:hypothetical protein